MISDPEGSTLVKKEFYAAPPLCSDPRSSTSSVTIPGKLSGDKFFVSLENFGLYASFLGNDCRACNFLGSSHSIAPKKIMIMGDEFLPPVVGSKTDCLPVLKVASGGGFEHLRVALEAQVMHGLKPREGMIMAVSLQTYLARVGSELFWTQFDEFSKWASETFSAIVMPFLTPFPCLLYTSPSPRDGLLSRMPSSA